MGRGTAKTKRASQRPALVVRPTQNQATQLARVRERRELPTQQMAASTVITAGLRALGLEDAVQLYHQGRSLEEAAREVGLPVSEVFEHFLRERIPLMENEDALSSLAQLADRYQLPQLTAAVTQIQKELVAQPA